MRGSATLRGVAIALAIAAIVDPAYTVTRGGPLPVLVRAASSAPEDRALADDVRRRLASRQGLALDPETVPAAVVVAGASLEPDTLPEGVPVSIVTRSGGPNVAVIAAGAAPIARVGLTTRLSAVVSAAGLAGRTTVVALEDQGMELGVVEHRWTADEERFEARFDHVPAAAGVRAIRIVARLLEQEIFADDNHADVRLAVEDRAFRVLVHEPRPSWGATFIRRALEGEPLFEVASLTRPSRDVVVRAGSSPRRLSAGAIEGFDVVVIGAPEELREAELETLSHFTRLRGGTVVFVPDRRPSGPYARRLPAAAFDEALHQAPSVLEAAAAPLRASEFAIPRRLAPAVRTLAALTTESGPSPVIVSWADGAGRTVFSGALDAWRFRAQDDGFGRFWRAQIAAAALGAPSRLEAALEPAAARPGALVRVRARLRADTFDDLQPAVELPALSARLLDDTGSVEPIRLWPAAEPGAYEGRLEAPAAGRYVVQVAAGGTMAADTVLVVRDHARAPSAGAPAGLRQLATSTGGVAVDAADLSLLDAHLAEIARPRVVRQVHPARSPWYCLTFIGLICAEWWLRRRRGAA